MDQLNPSDNFTFKNGNRIDRYTIAVNETILD